MKLTRKKLAELGLTTPAVKKARQSKRSQAEKSVTSNLQVTPDEYKALVRSAWKEEEFQNEVIALAHQHGWKCAHFRRVRVMRANQSFYYETPVQADGKGFVDLVCVKPGRRVLWLELKASGGQMYPEQLAWIELLRAAGESVHVFYPDQWDSIEQLMGELTKETA